MDADGGAGPATAAAHDTHTSADYYFDSYAHFGAATARKAAGCCALRGPLLRRAAAACLLGACSRALTSVRPRAGIHEEMLKDTVRTKTYQQAIYNVRAACNAPPPPPR
jgi:hypothetical protein